MKNQIVLFHTLNIHYNQIRIFLHWISGRENKFRQEIRLEQMLGKKKKGCKHPSNSVILYKWSNCTHPCKVYRNKIFSPQEVRWNHFTSILHPHMAVKWKKQWQSLQKLWLHVRLAPGRQVNRVHHSQADLSFLLISLIRVK